MYTARRYDEQTGAVEKIAAGRSLINVQMDCDEHAGTTLRWYARETGNVYGSTYYVATTEEATYSIVKGV